MRKHPVLLGLIVIGVILGVFLLSILFLTRFGEKEAFARGEKIAVVDIKGVITSSRHIVEQIDNFTEDEGVKAIILRINSPGGGVGPPTRGSDLGLRRENARRHHGQDEVALTGGA